MILSQLTKLHKPTEQAKTVSLSDDKITLADSFDDVLGLFKEYKIKSPYSSKNDYSYVAKKYNVRFDYPYLIVSYQDELKPSFYKERDYCPISISVKMHIEDVVFSSDLKMAKYGYDCYINFSSKQGIEISNNSKKTIESSYYFKSSEMTCKKISYALQVFQSKVISKKYTGTFNIPKITPKSQPAKAKTINNKYSQ